MISMVFFMMKINMCVFAAVCGAIWDLVIEGKAKKKFETHSDNKSFINILKDELTPPVALGLVFVVLLFEQRLQPTEFRTDFVAKVCEDFACVFLYAALGTLLVGSCVCVLSLTKRCNRLV